MGIASEQYIFAVDGGGSGCRVAIYDANKEVIASAKGAPANVFTNPDDAIRNVLDVIQKTAAQAGFTTQVIAQSAAHIGLAGVIDPTDGDRIAAAMPFAHLTVSDDRATSVAGAFGDSDGVLAAVGTGSFVTAQSSGIVRYFGGWGFDVSDQASGGWLGRHALQRTLLAHDGVIAQSDLTRHLLDHFDGSLVKLVQFARDARPSDMAAFAPRIVHAASRNDVNGVALMQEGVQYLMACIKAAQCAPGTTLCLTGGLGPHYAPYLDEDLRASLQAPAGTALDGAFHLAQRNLAKRAKAS
ncbi:N-acetylglucosamine kinase [Yoonia sp. F2084L]|uniref:BadF/BadG/BcrA/BcrD ATPase family protein n=1 Tax=Yoonia sp. F2084L TaxID=2926419 RepID=UPI001FF1AD01|nr:BadF/BadG/BcrA/BcrD ATPase family protein [Yoonia sp. F2084L]MCK0097390.1 N-acetylglucosamine kinase [Yoonia sp. F2084L]